MPKTDSAKHPRGSWGHRMPGPIMSHRDGSPNHETPSSILRAWADGGRQCVVNRFPYLKARLGENFNGDDLLDYMSERR